MGEDQGGGEEIRISPSIKILAHDGKKEFF
jgi:hypothetical protein